MCVFVNTPLIPWGSGVCQCRQEWGCKWRQSLGDGNTGDESWSARCTALFFSLKSLKQTYYSPFSKCNSLSSLAWFCQQRLLVDCAPFSTTFLEHSHPRSFVHYTCLRVLERGYNHSGRHINAMPKEVESDIAYTTKSSSFRSPAWFCQQRLLVGCAPFLPHSFSHKTFCGMHSHPRSFSLCLSLWESLQSFRKYPSMPKEVGVPVAKALQNS
jgi:hypothetical protein